MLLQTRATRMNDNSSRSHEIVRLYIESRPTILAGEPRVNTTCSASRTAGMATGLFAVSSKQTAIAYVQQRNMPGTISCA